MLFCGNSFGKSLRKFFTALAILSIFALPASASFVAPPQPVELAWNPSADPTVAGYMLSYGTSPTNFDNEIDAGTNTSLEVTDLMPGQTNYFTITAYNAQGVLGAPSGLIEYVGSTSTNLQETGGLEVTLNVVGAQWAVDGGGWEDSGTIVSGLSVGSHTIIFSSVDGWAAPAAESVSIANDQTNAITASYVNAPETSGLMVTLNILSAQWSVDGGAWQDSGAVVSGLSAGSHTVTFSTFLGWTAPDSETITLASDVTNSITVNYTYAGVPQTGGLQVALNVSTAQWSVDGGAWQNTGAIVSGLSVGSHIVTFSTVTGWTTPASQTVSVVASQTTSISATYVAVAQTGGLEVTLNATGAQWAVDQGTMQASGTTLSGLSAGSHTVSFSAVSGWTTPASQAVSIVANQTNSINATYVAAQNGSLRVTLNVGGAQWSVDNGSWQNSGATVSGLSVGTHTVTFSAVSGYTTPASQTITITANKTRSDSAAYVAVSSTGNLVVTLNVAGAQWSVDSGAWQNSGSTVSGLSVGSHTITFTTVSGWTTPASQTVSIVANQTASVTASYVAVPQTGSLQVTLNVPGAQWMVDTGTIQNSGAIVSGLSVGSHTINFSTMNGWTTPASQTVSIAANQTNVVTATYVAIPQTGSLQVTLNVPGAQWMVDNGTIQNSGAIVSGLSVGSHTINFSIMNGWTTPASQTVSIVANQTNVVTATYVAIPQTGALEATLSPAVAQWSVDSGVWQNSGVIVSGLSVGSHTVTFSAMSGWTTPAAQTVSVVANKTNSITATYVVIPQTGSLEVTLNVPGAQWMVDNGTIQNSGAIVSGLSVGTHTINFSTMNGWTTPASKTVSIVANQTNAVTATYVANPQTGAMQVNLSPAVAQWAVDGGVWQNSGAVVTGLSVGSHTVTFSSMSGWVRPISQTIAIAANQTNAISATYIAIPQTGALEVTVNPATAQWCVDNGSWQNSAATVFGLSIGSHTITFAPMNGWTTPASQTVSIVANQTNSVAANYLVISTLGMLQVNLTPAGAQWSVDNGTWQNSGAIVAGLSAGSHTISFGAISGWTRPFNQTVTIAANQTNSITAAYVAIPQTGALQVNLNVTAAQWCVDNGSWQNSGATVSWLSIGSHTLTFSATTNWLVPSNQVVLIVANQTNSISATYLPANSQNLAGGPAGTILPRGDGSQPGLQRKHAASSLVSSTQRNNGPANFQPKRLAEMAGTYNGLFYSVKGVTQETSGMLSGLVVNTNGTYSGKLLLHGSSLVVSGSFDAAGHSSRFLKRARRLGGPVILDMTLSWNGNQPGILGTVSGSDAAPWTANLIADPASASESSYQSTILFPPAENAPAGFGSATIINDGGSATVVGKLADGKRFSQHVTVSADGSAPFYVYLGANEVAFGWIMNLYSAKPGGEVAWIKGTTHMQRNYNEGFTSLIAATGSARSLAAPDRGPIDLASVMEQSSRDAQDQIAKISQNALTSTASVSPNGF